MTHTLVLNDEQLHWLRAALSADNLVVPVRYAKVAGEVYQLVIEAEPAKSPVAAG